MVDCKKIRENFTKLNVKDFANAIGIKYTTYRNYEINREPTIETLIAISKYLKMPLSVLIDDSIQYTPEQQKVIALVLRLNNENLIKLEERASVLYEMQISE